MPRNCRNFWLELNVDGRKAKLATGPAGAKGGFNLRIKVRDEGEVSDQVILVNGFAYEDGRLEVAVCKTEPGVPPMEVYRLETKR